MMGRWGCTSMIVIDAWMIDGWVKRWQRVKTGNTVSKVTNLPVFDVHVRPVLKIWNDNECWSLTSLYGRCRDISRRVKR